MQNGFSIKRHREITMLQATMAHRERVAPPNKQTRPVSSTTLTSNRKEDMIQQRLAAAEREIAFLQMQVHELKNAHVLLEKLYAEKTNSGLGQEQPVERFFMP